MRLIKNETYLIEDYKVNDLFGLEDEIGIISNYIDHSKDRSLIAIVGDYGIGKSTMLYQIETQNVKERWLYFDAWKYPERHSLWEGFVLDIADQVGSKSSTLRKIDGQNSKGVSIAKGFVGSLFATISKVPIAPVLKPLTDEIIKSYESAPVKRVFEIQSILQGLINSQTLPLRIVVEDVDRSGDSGVYFLETLNHFLKNNEFLQEIKVIVPMATNKYNVPENQESYLKSIDYVTFFKPEIKNIDLLFKTVFSKELVEPKNLPNITVGGRAVTSEILEEQIKQILRTLINGGLRPRQFKSMLREWRLAFERHEAAGKHPDWRIELLVQAGKFVPFRDHQSFYDEMVTKKRMPSQTIFGTFLYMIYSASPYIKQINSEEYIHSPLPIRFVEEDTNTIDLHSIYSPNSEQFYAISEWYLR